MEINFGPNVRKPTSSQSGEDEGITMITSGVNVCIACNSWSIPKEIQLISLQLNETNEIHRTKCKNTSCD